MENLLNAKKELTERFEKLDAMTEKLMWKRDEDSKKAFEILNDALENIRKDIHMIDRALALYNVK